MPAQANPNWWQEANSDLNTVGGNSFIGYGSNYPSPTTISTYEKCEIGPSIYIPVSADFNLDGLNEYVIHSNTSFKIYTQNCELTESFFPKQSIRSQIILMNTDGDSIPEIYFLGNESLLAYEYDTDTSTFSLFKEIDYSGETTNLDDMLCFNIPDGEKCLGLKSGSKNIIEFDLETSTVSTNSNQLIYNFDPPNNYRGYTTSRISNTEYLGVICSQIDLTNSDIQCITVNEDGDRQTTIDMDYPAIVLNDIRHETSFIAKHGGTYRIFISQYFSSLVNQYQSIQHAIYTIDGVEIMRIAQYGDNTVSVNDRYSISNWALADYDKDGDNDACIMYYNLTDDSSKFKCYSSTLTEITDLNINETLDLNSDFVFGITIADYNNSKSTLGVGTVHGVYYEEGSNLIQEYDSEVIGSTSNNGKGISVFTDLVGNVGFAYFDSTQGFLIKNSDTTVSCGDGICQALENALVCPADCGANVTLINETGDMCSVNEDCYTGLCENNICSLLPFKHECIANNQCLSGECNNGKCTNPDYWSRIDNAKTSIFGNTSSTNNFIALIFMFGLPALFLIYGNALGKWLAIPSFLGLSIFFAIVGWLSPFLLVGFLVSGLVIASLIFLLGGGSD